MRDARGGSIQGYTNQVVAGAAQIVLATRVVAEPNDAGYLEPMLTETETNLQRIGVDQPPGVLLADAGYSAEADLAAVATHPGTIALVALGKSNQVTGRPLDDTRALTWRQHQDVIDAEARAEQQRRAAVFARREAEGLLLKDMAAELEMSIPRVHTSFKQWEQGGVDAIGVARRGNPAPRPIERPPHREQMRERLSDPANKDLYRERAHLIETGFGNRKHNRAHRQYRRIGIDAAQSEAYLDGAIQNLNVLTTAFTRLANITTGRFKKPKPKP